MSGAGRRSYLPLSLRRTFVMNPGFWRSVVRLECGNWSAPMSWSKGSILAR